MVDRAESLAPTSLRYLMVKGPAELNQLQVGKLPEGARCVMQDSMSAFSAYAMGGPGDQEWVLVKQPLENPMPFGNGINPTGNAVQASDKASLWVRWPQIFSVNLNGTNQVQIDDVVTQVNASFQTVTNIWAAYNRVGLGNSPGHVVIVGGAGVSTAQSIFVSSSDASDNGVLRVYVWPLLGQR
jgi:hypothetical protein